ncbi:MAG: LamG-like jellyroll fold domain-containing protein [Planctomycetota bacterium]
MGRLRSLLVAAVTVAGVAPAQPATFQHTVSLGGTSYLVDFALHSARGPNFAVPVQQADGTFAMHAAGPVRTYIGAIAALPGAMASALRRADGAIYYHVLFADGAEWINNGGATTLRADASWTPNYPSFVTGSGGAGGEVWAAEIGVDLPYSQFQVDGDVAAALEMIEHSVNTVNLLYLRDTSILHRLGRVVIRADAVRDPYAGMTTTSALLGEISNQWNSVLPASTHDAALVATSATGGGLAAVGVIGSPGYSSNGATVEGDFTIVWRHEVGHNWSLGHFDGGTPEGATINSGNAMSRLSGPEQALALAHRAARTASLDRLGPYPVAIPPRASLDRAAFLPQSGARPLDVLDNDHDANGEPVRIAAFDAATRLGGVVALSAGTGPGGRDQLLYTPPAGLVAAPDHFSYCIADAAGREGLGHVITKLTSDEELLVHLPLDEGGGSVANDSSAYARHADLENGPAWGAGRRGGGVVFDGVDDRLVAEALDRATDEFTITGWIRRSGAQAPWAGLVFCRGGATTAGLNFGTNNELRYHWGGGKWPWSSGLVVPDQAWAFVALVVTPTGATIYLDAGEGLISATNPGTHAVEPFDAEVRIGNDPNSGARTFRGSMDDLRIYARALSSAEIAAAAAGSGSAGNPSPAHLGAPRASVLTLDWDSASATVDHRLYFSRSYGDVRGRLAAADQGTNPPSSWTTPGLGVGSWFWAVDSFDGTSWTAGPVWGFDVLPGPIAPFAQAYGVGCPGSSGAVPRIGVVGAPLLTSGTFAIEVAGAAPAAPAVLLLASSPDRIALSGCRLLLGLPVAATPPVLTDAAGRGATPLPLPFLPALLGAPLFGQHAIVDAGGALFGTAALSAGMHLTLGF